VSTNESDTRSQNERIQAEARALLDAELEAARQADERNPMLPSLRADPLRAAVTVLERFFTKNGLRQLIYYRENWYSYYDRLWGQRHEQDIDHFVHSKLIHCRAMDAEGEVIDFPTTSANVTEIRKQIQHIQTIPSHYRVPCVKNGNGKWVEIDAAGKMVCRGSLVDMKTGEVNDNHSLFIPNGAEWEYKPKARKPKHWHEFLESIFSDREEDVTLLQEWFGYVLSGDTWAQKGLIIVGPPRAGKGIIGHVLSNLLGKSMVSSPALHAIGTRFGLEDLIDKRLCLISDARLSNRQDIFAVIETLLRIIGGDSVSVDRKNKGALNLDLLARIMLLSNEMPQLSDNSTAINNRFLIMNLHESFLGREDVHLLDKLMKELPAIANWAIEGYKRLIATHKFSEPESSKIARQEWYEENNPLAQFVEDCCEVDAGHKVAMTELFDAYKAWCEGRGYQSMAANALSRRLSAMLGARITRVKNDNIRYVGGIGLRKSSREAF
jgi:putative DNA primase/helicase